MLTREEVIEMLKEVYNNDISDFNIDKLSIDELKDLVIEGCKPKSRIPVYDYSKIKFQKIQNSQKRIRGLHQVAEPIQRHTSMMKMVVLVNVRRLLL